MSDMIRRLSCPRFWVTALNRRFCGFRRGSGRLRRGYGVQGLGFMTKKESRKRRNFHSCGVLSARDARRKTPWNLAAKLSEFLQAQTLEVDAQQNANRPKKEGKSALQLSSLSCSVSAKKQGSPRNQQTRSARERRTHRETRTHREMANKEERIVAVAALQFACTDDVDTNVAKAEKWVVLPLPQFFLWPLWQKELCLHLS